VRLCIVGAALLLSISTHAAAQSRWTFSAGPEWGKVTPANSLWGMRLRAEYDLTKPSSVFGVRLEGGTRWGPTQSFFYRSIFGRESGTEQRMDLMLGFSGALSPFPHARFSPYVTMGIFGQQTWLRGSRFVQDSIFGSSTVPSFSLTRGDIVATLGLGLRARTGSRSFQLELRRVRHNNGLSFGTRLPF
jgi:hypothetical protein